MILYMEYEGLAKKAADELGFYLAEGKRDFNSTYELAKELSKRDSKNEKLLGLRLAVVPIWNIRETEELLKCCEALI